MTLTVRRRVEQRAPADAPALTRSPIHLYTLLIGAVVTAMGWIVATVFERSVNALSSDLVELADVATWADNLPQTTATVGTIAAIVAVNTWLLARRRFRELFLAYLAGGLAAVASGQVSDVLLDLLRPETRDWFDNLPDDAARLLPTDPVVAAVIAAVVVIRRSVSARVRHRVYVLAAIWVLANVTIAAAPPYLGVVLDVGIGMLAGSVTALALRTPTVRPGRDAIAAGLERVGIHVSSLEPAGVDARGSAPWVAVTASGQFLFVKALSTEQRVADLMFRLMRWLRLRRTGDAPPETSLRRSAEHEAFVSHHARLLGVPTPTLLAVADVGDENVALVYELETGRSLDRVPAAEITDDHLRQLWHHVRLLRTNGVAHRDLRLANVFLTDDGEILLIDFGFAELAATRHVLDEDVAEALAATAALVGVERAVRACARTLGTDPLEGALEWMHPLGFSTATRDAVAEADVLADLRNALAVRVGHGRVGAEPVGRLDVYRAVGAAFVLGGFGWLIAALPDDDTFRRLRDAELDLAFFGVVAGTTAHLATGLAFRAASQRRVSGYVAAGAHLASRLPRRMSTSWVSAVDHLTLTAEGHGMTQNTARRAAAMWSQVGLVVTPLLVGGLAAAALRASRGYVVGIVLGAAIGLAVAAVVAGAVWCLPWGQELRNRWSQAPPLAARDRASTAGTATWWLAAALLRGTTLVLAARALDATTESQTLLAIAVAAETLASLTPTRGGLGATELFLLAGLSLHLPVADAALAVILYRLATYWLLLPLAAAASRWAPSRAERQAAPPSPSQSASMR